MLPLGGSDCSRQGVGRVGSAGPAGQLRETPGIRRSLRCVLGTERRGTIQPLGGARREVRHVDGSGCPHRRPKGERMPQPPRQLEPGRSNRDWFGAELRHWRRQRGLTQDQLGALVHVSGDLIAKIEKAVRACTPGLAEALDAVLETGGVLGRALVRVLAEADNRMADVDSTADTGRNGGPPLPDEAMLGPADGDEVRVPCRTAEGRIIIVTMPRRALLRGGAAGAALLAMGAASGHTRTLHSTAFAPEVHPVRHLRQLRRTLVDCDNLLGPSRAIETVRDHIRLIKQLRRNADGADHRALLQVQAEYAEFCGWLYQDAGDHDAARYWTDRALDWAHADGRREPVAYVMIRKAQLAAERRDPVETADLSLAAQHLAPPRSRFAAMSTLSSAHGHALGGDKAACHRAYDTVFGLMDHLTGDTPHRRGTWMDTPHVQAQRAHCLSLLGEHEAAAEGFTRAISALPPTYRRDRGFVLSQAAIAHAHADEPEQAALKGIQAIPIATETGSARIFDGLSLLDADLRRLRTSATEVIQFREALDSVVLHQA
ncbi:helix-turn-helix domain-containing protein [Streptomyces sp. NPDC059479]|uniref:helix-turn-helix domain-containing protein n=1 Tax=Streptomyces sp. NPDC059479 TaxID=3346848 RepID=UPI00367CC8C9